MKVEELFEHFNSKNEAIRKLNDVEREIFVSPKRLNPKQDKLIYDSIAAIRAAIESGRYASARQLFSKLLKDLAYIGVDSKFHKFDDDF